MTITQELVERVERAAGPDRELTALVRCAALAPKEAFVQLSPINGAWCIYEISYTGKERSWEPRGLSQEQRLGDFLTSVDAAISLLPEGWWLYAVDASISGRFVVSLRGPLMAVEYEDTIARISDMMIPAVAAGIANSLATAITAASLRARMVQQ